MFYTSNIGLTTGIRTGIGEQSRPNTDFHEIYLANKEMDTVPNVVME